MLCWVGLGWVVLCCVGLSQLADVTLSCFTLSSSAVFTERFAHRTQKLVQPLLEAVLYSVLWVRKLENTVSRVIPPLSSNMNVLCIMY